MFYAWQAFRIPFRTSSLFELNNWVFAHGPLFFWQGAYAGPRMAQFAISDNMRKMFVNKFIRLIRIVQYMVFVLDASKNEARRTSSHHQTIPNQKVFQHVLYIWVAIFICNYNCNDPVSLSATLFW